MKGIDISAYQGNVPWRNLQDISFGIMKVTEGEGYVNPYWAPNAAAMHKENKIRGFYLFSLPGLDANTPEGEAAYFYSKVEHTLMKGDLVAVDVEKTYLQTAFATSNWVYRLLTHLEQLIKFRPLLYSYPDFIKTQLTDERLSRWPLWLAWYQDTLPHSFAQWHSIALWQNGPGKVKGEAGSVDIDTFFLTAKELERYGKP